MDIMIYILMGMCVNFDIQIDMDSDTIFFKTAVIKINIIVSCSNNYHL